MNTKTKKRKKKLNNDLNKELAELKSQAHYLETRISIQKKENFKQFNIRNLKLFANTCHLAAPFVISAGITVGTFYNLNGGLPFYTDEITKYKKYDLDFQTDGYVATNEEYIIYIRKIDTSNLIIYTPWEMQDDHYIRYKREYDVDKQMSLDLYNAVLEEDYNYISENIEKFKEEKQVINKRNYNEANNYSFEANLHLLDTNDILTYDETDLKNILITISELVICLLAGSIYTYCNKFNFLDNVRKINTDYKDKIIPIESMKQELDDTKKKILTLTKSKEGPINEK